MLNLNLTKENQLLILVNVALLIAQIGFGGFNVVGKYALDYSKPIIFAFYREVLSGPLLLIIAAIVERVFPERKDWWRFGVLGVVLYGSQLCFIMGLKLTDSATQTAIMQQCIPVFTATLTVILRMEKFSVLKLGGLVCAIGGAIVMIGINDLSLENSRTVGMLFLAAQCFLIAINYVFQKPVLAKYPPITVTGLSYIVASVAMGLTSLYYVKDTSVYKLSDKVYWPLGYAVVIQTIMGYCIVSWANSKVPATIVAVYTCVQPLVAFILARIFFNEKFVWNEGVGMVLVILGLAFVTVARAREQKQKEKEDIEVREREREEKETKDGESEQTKLLPSNFSVVINDDESPPPK